MPMLTASGRAFDPKCLAAGVMIEAGCLPDVAHSLAQRFLERYHTLRQDILGRWPDSRQER